MGAPRTARTCRDGLRRPGGPRRLGGPDAGTTLVEVMVTLALLGTTLTVFTGAIVQMYREVNRSESIGSAQSQVTVAYQRLDRQIRYASDITVAGAVGGDWYVEYLTVARGTSVCTQLRVRSGQLQTRTWTETKLATTKSAWSVLATGVQTAGGAPFEVLPADAAAGFERLRLRLTAAAGTGVHRSRSETDITFTAMNTVRDGKESACAEGRSAP